MATASVVVIGSCVRVQDGGGDSKFRIVEPADADIAEERISSESPLGRALMGRHAGDEVRFRVPGGVRSVTVVEVNV